MGLVYWSGDQCGCVTGGAAGLVSVISVSSVLELRFGEVWLK